MAQVLSQDEIDALLGGLDDVTESEEGNEEAEAASSSEGTIIPYDFANAAKMTKVKLPAFAAINDHFNRGLRTTFSSILRVMVDSAIVPIEIITFKEFLKRVPVPSSLHILKMEPLRGHIIMVIDPQLVFSIVEIFMGSTSLGKSRIEGREFTSIEQRMIQRVVNAILKDLERAWQAVYPVSLQYVRSEINPQFAKIVQDDDVVIVSKFQVDIEEMSGVIHITVPISVIQPIKKNLQSSFQTEEGEDPAWRRGMLQNLRLTPVELTVPLGHATISGADLLDLEEGDIIQLDTRIDDLLYGMLEGQVKFKGFPGLYKGQRAFKIDSVITDLEEI